MAPVVAQSILDALTDVDLPSRILQGIYTDSVTISGVSVPVCRCGALVLGSGAAGLRAAVELKRHGVDVAVATRSYSGGTSARSGSDKQTLHTACTRNHGDDFTAMAKALGSGGGMDEDTAYVEAVGSIQAMAGLQFLGLPLPEDRYGAVLRYQTDHDEAGRATSCGPRTSRLMVKVLAEECIRLNVPFFNHTTGCAILKRDGRLAGLLAVCPDMRAESNPFGFVVFSCAALVLAGGGPGELFRESTFPKNCFGTLGLALQAGIDTVNLTEHQFGIGTPRDGFAWNLSGTYAQAMPYIYSVDADGVEHNFLADSYRTTRELASNIFRKGYQWPFHAERMLNFGSSLVDLAVYEQTRIGRKVFMDFTRNPEPVPGDAPFALERLDEDVHAYLANNDALLETPIARLAKMNPLSIELYKRHGQNLAASPLAFSVNHQHMNGGVAVDIWARTSLPGCYAIGEAAGTHGVTRPGGSALNAGQVFAMRSARHIAQELNVQPDDALPHNAMQEHMDWVLRGLNNQAGAPYARVRSEVQARMTEYAGCICRPDCLGRAIEEAADLNRSIREHGVSFSDPVDAAHSVLWKQMALASEAILRALDDYARHGGGSRGARAFCSEQGTSVPETRQGPLEAYRFIPESPSAKDEQIHVTFTDGRFVIERRKIRTLESMDAMYFEKNWPGYLNGDIYK